MFLPGMISSAHLIFLHFSTLLRKRVANRNVYIRLFMGRSCFDLFRCYIPMCRSEHQPTAVLTGRAHYQLETRTSSPQFSMRCHPHNVECRTDSVLEETFASGIQATAIMVLSASLTSDLISLFNSCRCSPIYVNMYHGIPSRD